MTAGTGPDAPPGSAPLWRDPLPRLPSRADSGGSPTALPPSATAIDSRPNNEMFVILSMAGQLCGLPVRGVRHVLNPQSITPIPLAPPDFVGSLNLRGHVVTAVDLQRRLGLPSTGHPSVKMSIVAEHGTALYALLVDKVTEVLTPSPSAIESIPPTLPHLWRRFGVGIHRMDEALVVMLDLMRILDFSQKEG